ncbi:MAG: dTDP-4-dehydrorhamnose reductase [Blastocatellia bacterium]|jgi:dTDP-4-dehydrorhamnose reductase|nr:dTDP-4-dehydrorhamnose reductase [Blastocatellia bacterium]
MKILILGGSGMLGHKLGQTLAERFETYLTFRGSPALNQKFALYDPARALGHVSVQDFDSVVSSVLTVRPDVVVNCIGIVKQDAAAKDSIQSISVNALFPHQLARLCHRSSARLVHISTDCVFSGNRGNYEEQDEADARDLYGRTKLLGEVDCPSCLTIRTSMIGRELKGSHGLVEWLLSKQGERVCGFKRAIFSGFTTRALSEIIADVIEKRPELEGVYHVAAKPITKFDLLSLINEIYGLRMEIAPDESFVCDRSLNGDRFNAAASFIPPSWPEMIERMRSDATPYEEMRNFKSKGD